MFVFLFRQGCYMTIHITPEHEFSYVSFETNVPSSSYRDIIGKVLDTFLPGKFTITVFANQVIKWKLSFTYDINVTVMFIYRLPRLRTRRKICCTWTRSATGHAGIFSSATSKTTIWPTRSTANSRAEGVR